MALVKDAQPTVRNVMNKLAIRVSWVLIIHRITQDVFHVISLATNVITIVVFLARHLIR